MASKIKSVTSSAYDPKFDKAIRAKHPQWFDGAKDKQAMLLDSELFPAGCPRPTANPMIQVPGRVSR
jgi:hypothetical protein